MTEHPLVWVRIKKDFPIPFVNPLTGARVEPLKAGARWIFPIPIATNLARAGYAEAV